MTPTVDVEKDKKKEKDEYSVERIKIIDGKISATFVEEKNVKNRYSYDRTILKSEQYQRIPVDKIFDNWDDFTTYAKAFLK